MGNFLKPHTSKKTTEEYKETLLQTKKEEIEEIFRQLFGQEGLDRLSSEQYL